MTPDEPTGVTTSICSVDAPPASLYRRSPTAFHLWVEFAETPNRELTVSAAARLTSTAPAAARRALSELVAAGVVEQMTPGRYRATKATQNEEPPSARTCSRCGTPLTGRQRLYCSSSCLQKTSRRRAAAKRAEVGQDAVRRCAVCQAPIPKAPENKNRVYCSKQCKYLYERQALIRRAVAEGTAGICLTCGRPTRTGRSRWCSTTCRAQAAKVNREADAKLSL